MSLRIKGTIGVGKEDSMEKQKLSKSGFFALTGPLRWIVISGLIFFLSAGRTDILRAWLYFSIMLIVSTVGSIALLIKSPGLLNARGSKGSGTKKWDIFILLGIFLLGILGIPLTAGLDTRFNISLLPFETFYPGIIIYILSAILSTWPMMSNPHFEGTVRIQTDRDHTVIKTGPYKIIRHPGYLGMVLGALPMPFALGSLISFIPSGLMIVLIIIRTYLEDKTLQKELPGYAEYCNEVKYRLIPFIW